MAVHSMTNNKTEAAHRVSMQRVLLHTEGVAVFILSIFLYRHTTDASWLTFGLLLLAPDLAFLAVLVKKEIGIYAYNLVHSYVGPLLLGGVALLTGWNLGLAFTLIWTAHIGIDRTVGYGLKYSLDKGDTHLNRT